TSTPRIRCFSASALRISAVGFSPSCSLHYRWVWSASARNPRTVSSRPPGSQERWRYSSIGSSDCRDSSLLSFDPCLRVSDQLPSQEVRRIRLPKKSGLEERPPLLLL